jgi:hypothetical protein
LLAYLKGLPWVWYQKLKLSYYLFLYSPCHLLQNDVWFTVIGQQLMFWWPLEFRECNAFSSTFITERVHQSSEC